MSKTPLLEVKDLVAAVDGKTILNGISLTVYPGEVHAIMGPNGSGKSTLSNVLAGREDYEVVSGSVSFKGNNLFDLEPEERAREGSADAGHASERFDLWRIIRSSFERGRIRPRIRACG